MPRGANWLLPAVGLPVFAAFAVLFVVQPGLYAKILGLWSFEVLPQPFVDLDGPLAWIRCWREGADIFLEATCDIFGRPINYSPLVLWLPLPWVEPESAPLYGTLLDIFYLVSLAVLPRPRAPRDMVVMLLAAFSPFAMFGLERANFDLLMFVLAALAMLCLERALAWRLLGYAIIILAGLLKFYPWVLLLLLLRERPAVFLAVSAVFVAILVAFVGSFPVELGRIAANLPDINPFRDGFGAAILPTGLVIVTHLLHASMGLGDRIDKLVWWGSALALHGVAVVGAVRLASSAALRRGMARLSVREAQSLAVGAVLMCGCFFTGGSIGYRAVMLLFALPGLLALARLGERRWFVRVVRGGIAAAIVVLWSLPVQRLLIAAFGQFWQIAGEPARPVRSPLPSLLFWLLREALWWCVMTLLLAVVLRTLVDGRAWRDAWRWASDSPRPA